MTDIKVWNYSFDLVGNVLGYTNDCTGRGDYTTSQTYTYDNLLLTSENEYDRMRGAFWHRLAQGLQ